jgi:hypothetical protein
VVVVHESPWDDASRAEAEALADIEDNRHRCGHDLDKATADDTAVVVEDFVCAYCRAVDRVERKQRDEHDEAWADGRFWFARDYDPQLDAGKPRHRHTQPSKNGRSNGAGRMAMRR